MTWTSFHRRGDVLREVIAIADARRDGRLPMDAPGLRDRVATMFGDELTLVGALQLRWHTRLAGRIERELMQQPADPETAVVAAWQATAQDLPGVRAIVDHYRAEPLDAAMGRAMATATGKEHAFLAAMAGRAGLGSGGAGVRIGQQIEERARAGLRVAA